MVGILTATSYKQVNATDPHNALCHAHCIVHSGWHSVW